MDTAQVGIHRICIMTWIIHITETLICIKIETIQMHIMVVNHIFSFYKRMGFKIDNIFLQLQIWRCYNKQKYLKLYNDLFNNFEINKFNPRFE